MTTDDEAYQEVAAYTLGLHDAAFIHQHIVDAYAVHAAMPTDKPIRIAQALVGLFLHVEHGLTGRQVQRVHHILAAQRPAWPRFVLPDDRGPITIHDVIAEPPGERRDRAIETLATSTWNACRALRESIQAFLSLCGVTPPCDLTTGLRRRGADPSRTGPRCQFGSRVGSGSRAKLCVPRPARTRSTAFAFRLRLRNGGTCNLPRAGHVL